MVSGNTITEHSKDSSFMYIFSFKDIIIIKNDKPYYAQIKTLEGTLTGSQVPRSESELAMHKNSYFVAAFKTGTPWTFNSKIIKKLVGEEYWSLIELDYNFIANNVKIANIIMFAKNMSPARIV